MYESVKSTTSESPLSTRFTLYPLSTASLPLPLPLSLKLCLKSRSADEKEEEEEAGADAAPALCGAAALRAEAAEEEEEEEEAEEAEEAEAAEEVEVAVRCSGTRHAPHSACTSCSSAAYTTLRPLCTIAWCAVYCTTSGGTLRAARSGAQGCDSIKSKAADGFGCSSAGRIEGGLGSADLYFACTAHQNRRIQNGREKIRNGKKKYNT